MTVKSGRELEFVRFNHAAYPKIEVAYTTPSGTTYGCGNTVAEALRKLADNVEPKNARTTDT